MQALPLSGSLVEGTELNSLLWGKGDAVDLVEFALVSALLERLCSLPDSQVVDVGANSGWVPAIHKSLVVSRCRKFPAPGALDGRTS